ncbi:MAG: gliding motility-associated C-terminal domain-containing protein [Bacteroidales bacterium]|nr:gliding motility-associated C-terminal domain-containing protein [Bacteroidales bacterium]
MFSTSPGKYLQYTLIILISFFLIVGTAKSVFAQDEYHLVIGGEYDDNCRSALPTPDNGLMIMGSTSSYGSGDQDILISRIDSLGYIIWNKIIGTVDRDLGYFLKPDHNGGYIAICWVNVTPPSYDDWYIIKFDLDGNITQEKFFGGGSDDEVHSFCLTDDGGYVFAGNTRSFGIIESDMFIVKTDSALTVEWSKAFDAGAREHSRGVKQTASGNYIILVNTYEPTQNLYLLFLTPAGDLIWSRQFGVSGLDYGWSVVIAEDGNFIVCGYTENFGAQASDILVFKISPSGNVIWAKIYGGTGNEIAYDIESTVPGRYMISATTTSFGNGMEDFLMMQINEDGDLINAHTYGGTGEEFQPFMDKAQNNGLSVSGATNSYGEGGFDIYIIKTDSDGASCCGQELTELNVTGINLVSSDLNLVEHDEVGYPTHTMTYQNTVPGHRLLCYDNIHLQGDRQLCTISDTGHYSIRPMPNIDLEWVLPQEASILAYQGDSAIQVRFEDSPGYVSYQIIEGCNNPGPDTLWIDIHEADSPNLGPDTLLCNGDPFQLDAGEGYSGYLWQDDSTEQFFSVINTGSYFVEVTDSLGCSASDTISINLVDIPNIFLGNDTNIRGNFSLILDAGSGFDSYYWQDGSGGQTFTANAPGLYWVESGKEGCFASDSLMISNDFPSKIWFPNCFTPNLDGFNDVFKPVYENITVYSLIIFNRWGQILYESMDIDEGWDGNFNGRKCPAGVYFFTADYAGGSTGNTSNVLGSVTLLR